MSVALRSTLLAAAGFEHAFFLRALGGRAERAAAELGVEASRLYYLSQVHGVDVRILRGDEDRGHVARERGDVTASAAAGTACAVRTADCAPVLLADRRSGAVAAVHSGWRGTVAGVAAAAIDALRGLACGEPDVIAAIGPCIEACCFEVGTDVAERLAAVSSAGTEAVLPRHPRPHVDLRRVIAAQLRAVGVAEVDQVAGCTMCDERFDSFRRDGPAKSGRMIAAIVAGRRA